jgi:DNA-binding MarR family transcriptional regulator
VEVSELASRLRLAIARSARRLRQEALRAEGDATLSPTLTAAMATIEAHGPLTPSELAEREGISRPTTTRIVARLVEAGLVARTADPRDKRSDLLTATPAGKALLKRLRGRKNAYLARRIRDLDPADLSALERAATILERILDGRPREAS